MVYYIPAFLMHIELVEELLELNRGAILLLCLSCLLPTRLSLRMIERLEAVRIIVFGKFLTRELLVIGNVPSIGLRFIVSAAPRRLGRLLSLDFACSVDVLLEWSTESVLNLKILSFLAIHLP